MKHVNIQVKYKILLYIIICKDIETFVSLLILQSEYKRI